MSATPELSPAPSTSGGPRVTPRVSGAVPVLGHATRFMSDPLGLLRQARAECGDVAAFKVAGRRMVLLSGPRAQEAFFRAPDTELSQRAAYQFMVPIFGKDVAYDAPPARMREQLGFLIPALQESRMRTYGEIVAQETRAAVERLGTDGLVDVYPFTTALTTYTASHCLLGREFREELSDEFARLYADLRGGINSIAYLNPYLPLPAFRRRDRARARLMGLVGEIAERRRASGHRGDDFMQSLIDARYQDGAKLSEHEITGLIIAALFSGLETSAATAAWCLLELVAHPDRLSAVREEVDRALGPDRVIDHDAVRELPVTDRSIREGLRLHPPFVVLIRAAVGEWGFDGYRFAPGTWFVVSPFIAHELPELFEDPATFDPDRFTPERGEGKTAFTYIPFGGGRHPCLGSAFAMLQLKIIVATLVQRLDLGASGDQVRGDFSGVVGPRSPARIRYRRRAHWAA